MNTSMTPYQRLVVALLAFLQFTLVLDFMLLSPLGAILMPSLKISPSQFGLVVSAYAFSAGASGFLAAGFADRFDRKKLLLFFYSGFILGTLFCGLAQTYTELLWARIVTGLFGGVIGSISLAIVTDLFPFEQRGRVMGTIQTAFAASEILGIPFGLYLANFWNWHGPFLLIVAVATLVGFVLVFYLQPIDQHLKDHRPSPLKHVGKVVARKFYLQGFATTALLRIGGFMLMPFVSAFNVHNLGVELMDLPKVYVITGACAILFTPLLGRLSDRIGKFQVFMFGSLLAVLVVAIYTRLSLIPFWSVAVISIFMNLAGSSRMVASSAMLSAVPEAADRGAYMAISSSLQQVAGGVGAALAGWIVVADGNGPLKNFDVIGNVMIGTMLLCLLMTFFINRSILRRTKA